MSCSPKSSLVAVALVFFGVSPCFAHVVLDAPNGGETLEVGSEFTITWEISIAHDLQNWDVWYSTAGPSGPWIPIAMDLPAGSSVVGSVHTYDWTVPAEAISDQVRVRVRMDNSGTDYEDISDGDFIVIELASGGFTRGDADGDNVFNGLNDALYVLTFQFSDGPAPPCLEAADADDNGDLNGLVDGLFMLSHQFLGGPPPPPPYPDCDADATTPTLGCDAYTC